MSITDPDKIDIVATRPESRVVSLVITDHLPWDDFEEHAQLLQDKVNTYLAFVESGQLSRLKTPPLPPDPEVRIVVAMQSLPTPEADEFLEQVSAALASAGIGFAVEVHPRQS